MDVAERPFEKDQVAHHKREARRQQETQRQKMNLTADGRRYLRTLYQPTV
jgi:hypothetical protein